MIQAMTQFLLLQLWFFGIALLVCLLRLIKGPTTADRVVSFDATSAVVMCIVGVMSVIMGTVSFLDSIMLIAIISFVSRCLFLDLLSGGAFSMETVKEIVSLISSIFIFLV